MSDKKQSIGAIWKKQVNGKELLSGSVEIEGKTYKLAIWANDYKKEAKHPDYKIYLDTYEPNNRQQNEFPANNLNSPGNSVSRGTITPNSIVQDDFNLSF